ncbi:hypothetical protein SNEBB_010765 [Seison nebaliae]|nr:hypothetical protein SNEBB_010765 [Seison nebaliae]
MISKNLFLNTRNVFPLTNGIRNYRRANRNIDSKFRHLRAQKVVKIDLPNFDEAKEHEKLSMEERRKKSLKDGISPFRQFEFRPMLFSTTGGIIDTYVPPEADGKSSIISQDGMKQFYQSILSKGTVYKHLKKVRSFDDEFDTDLFADNAQVIYEKAHKALMDRNKRLLHQLTTEMAYSQMTSGLRDKTFKWKIVERIQPPRIVHVKTQEMLSDETIFGQITVRIHSKQTISVYDRFGYLMFGDPEVPREILDYMVFEKLITDTNGEWRLHTKIIPEWQQKQRNINAWKTYVTTN